MMVFARKLLPRSSVVVLTQVGFTIVPSSKLRPERTLENHNPNTSLERLRGNPGLHTRHGDGLLEEDRVGARDAANLHEGITLEGNTESLIGQQPGVESCQGLNIINVQELREGDMLLSIGRSRREVELGERRMRVAVLEVHDALKGSDVSLDGTIGLDGAAEADREVLRLRVGDCEAVQDELGLVNLGLRNFRNGDKQAS